MCTCGYLGSATMIDMSRRPRAKMARHPTNEPLCLFASEFSMLALPIPFRLEIFAATGNWASSSIGNSRPSRIQGYCALLPYVCYYMLSSYRGTNAFFYARDIPAQTLEHPTTTF